MTSNSGDHTRALADFIGSTDEYQMHHGDGHDMEYDDYQYHQQQQYMQHPSEYEDYESQQPQHFQNNQYQAQHPQFQIPEEEPVEPEPALEEQPKKSKGFFAKLLGGGKKKDKKSDKQLMEPEASEQNNTGSMQNQSQHQADMFYVAQEAMHQAQAQAQQQMPYQTQNMASKQNMQPPARGPSLPPKDSSGMQQYMQQQFQQAPATQQPPKSSQTTADMRKRRTLIGSPTRVATPPMYDPEDLQRPRRRETVMFAEDGSIDGGNNSSAHQQQQGMLMVPDSVVPVQASPDARHSVLDMYHQDNESVGEDDDDDAYFGNDPQAYQQQHQSDEDEGQTNMRQQQQHRRKYRKSKFPEQMSIQISDFEDTESMIGEAPSSAVTETGTGGWARPNTESLMVLDNDILDMINRMGGDEHQAQQIQQQLREQYQNVEVPPAPTDRITSPPDVIKTLNLTRSVIVRGGALKKGPNPRLPQSQRVQFSGMDEVIPPEPEQGDFEDGQQAQARPRRPRQQRLSQAAMQHQQNQQAQAQQQPGVQLRTSGPAPQAPDRNRNRDTMLMLNNGDQINLDESELDDDFSGDDELTAKLAELKVLEQSLPGAQQQSQELVPQQSTTISFTGQQAQPMQRRHLPRNPSPLANPVVVSPSASSSSPDEDGMHQQLLQQQLQMQMMQSEADDKALPTIPPALPQQLQHQGQDRPEWSIVPPPAIQQQKLKRETSINGKSSSNVPMNALPQQTQGGQTQTQTPRKKVKRRHIQIQARPVSFETISTQTDPVEDSLTVPKEPFIDPNLWVPREEHNQSLAALGQLSTELEEQSALVEALKQALQETQDKLESMSYQAYEKIRELSEENQRMVLEVSRMRAREGGIDFDGENYHMEGESTTGSVVEDDTGSEIVTVE